MFSCWVLFWHTQALERANSQCDEATKVKARAEFFERRYQELLQVWPSLSLLRLPRFTHCRVVGRCLRSLFLTQKDGFFVLAPTCQENEQFKARGKLVAQQLAEKQRAEVLTLLPFYLLPFFVSEVPKSNRGCFW